jgi:hypothetical protein
MLGVPSCIYSTPCWLIRVPLSNLFAVLPLVLKMYLDTLNYPLGVFVNGSFIQPLLWSLLYVSVEQHFYWHRYLAQNMRHQIIQRQICKRKFYIHTVAQRSVNLKYSLVLTRMFRFQPSSQSVERYHIVMSCASNVKDLISKISLNSMSNKDISYIFRCTVY